MIYELKDTSKVEKLFEGPVDSLVTSCLEGMMDSKIYVTDLEHPRSAMAFLACFAFFAGEPNRELASFKPKGVVGMVPYSEGWAKLIEECQPDADKVTRYAIQKGAKFDRANLQRLVDALPEGYEIKRIDGELYDKCLEIEDFEDGLCHFASKEQYLEMGRGFAAIKDGEPVSVASSYTVYREGIEIEIDTLEEERRKGLASAVCARLILSCLDDGLYPSWDAANMNSVHLAEKLGYEFSHEYPCYWLDGLLDIVVKAPDRTSWPAFCGRYELPIKDHRIYEVSLKGENLYMRFVNTEGKEMELKLWPIGPDAFGLLWGDDRITFTPDALVLDGEVVCKKICKKI
ncbi:MAG: GNAT family N-acetyltransferase [Clostridia bacterium]|nr:GNAT family N-acetyltransferase [Clostridia bacterium]